jgi:hypothetical protein
MNPLKLIVTHIKQVSFQLQASVAEFCTVRVSLCFVTHIKGKVHPRTGHEGPEGELRYSSTLSLPSALDGVSGQRHALAALPPGKTIV